MKNTLGRQKKLRRIKMKFIVACKKFFELKKDQKLGQFVSEVKKLTTKDKDELRPDLEKALKLTNDFIED